eukprot:GEMP01007462.1.p1 GENE.GEMP01007462.1~~GEMP01007462.1.p1  ORF type:complete len:217 (+),score=33.67 GEMP01007462.1:799-1449(+)
MASADTVNDSFETSTFNFKEHFSNPECNFNEFYPANYELFDSPTDDQCFPDQFLYSEYDDHSWLYCMDTSYTPYDDDAVYRANAATPKKFEFSAEAKEFVLPTKEVRIFSRNDMLKLRPPKFSPLPPTLTKLPSFGERPPSVSARSTKKRSAITVATSPTSLGAANQRSPGFSPSHAGGRDSDKDNAPTSPPSSSSRRSNTVQTPVRANKGGKSEQ